MSHTPQRPRIAVFDTLRGFTIFSMVLFHACYDAAYLWGIPMPWFMGTPLQAIWRASISWTFLFLAGWMTTFSRSNLRRAARYGAAAFAVFLATSLAGVDTAISFGILFCMAASTLLGHIVRKSGVLTRPAAVLLGAVIAFALTYALPLSRYPVEGLAWLGFPSPTFTSGDYYPLIPYFFMYLAGMAASSLFERAREGAYPIWMQRDWCPVLTFVGRLSLPIYLAHQPLLIAIGMVLGY